MCTLVSCSLNESKLSHFCFGAAVEKLLRCGQLFRFVLSAVSKTSRYFRNHGVSSLSAQIVCTSVEAKATMIS